MKMLKSFCIMGTFFLYLCVTDSHENLVREKRAVDSVESSSFTSIIVGNPGNIKLPVNNPFVVNCMIKSPVTDIEIDHTTDCGLIRGKSDSYNIELFIVLSSGETLEFYIVNKDSDRHLVDSCSATSCIIPYNELEDKEANILLIRFKLLRSSCSVYPEDFYFRIDIKYNETNLAVFSSVENYQCALNYTLINFSHRPHTGSSSTQVGYCIKTGYEILTHSQSYLWHGYDFPANTVIVGVRIESMGSFFDFEVERVKFGYRDGDAFVNIGYGGDFVLYFEGFDKSEIQASVKKTYKFEHIPLYKDNIHVHMEFIPGNYIERYACVYIYLLKQSLSDSDCGITGSFMDVCQFPEIHQCSEGCQFDGQGGYTCYCFYSTSVLAQDGKTCRNLQLCEPGWRYSPIDDKCYLLVEHKPLDWNDYLAYCGSSKILTDYKVVYDERFPYNIVDRNYYHAKEKEQWFHGLYTSTIDNKTYWVNGVKYEDYMPYNNVYSGVGNILDVVGVYDETVEDWKQDIKITGYYICSRPKGPNGNCFALWKSYGDTCYFFSNRHKKLTFEEASDECSKISASLAILNVDGVTSLGQELANEQLFPSYQSCMPRQTYWAGIINGQQYYLSGYNLYKANGGTASFFCEDTPKRKEKDSFTVHSGNVTFHQAVSKCEQEKGYLALTSDLEEFRQMNSLVTSDNEFWPIGLIDINNLNKFDTTVYGSDVVIDFWRILQPADYPSMNSGQCAYIRSSNLEWTDLPCSQYSQKFICKQNDDSLERYLLSSLHGVRENQISLSKTRRFSTDYMRYGYGPSRVVRRFQSLNRNEIGNAYWSPWQPDQSNPDLPVFIMVNFYSEVRVTGLVIEGKCSYLSFSLRCQLISTYSYYKSTDYGRKIISKLNSDKKRDIIYLEYPLYCYQVDMIWSKDSVCEIFTFDYIGTQGHYDTDLYNECNHEATNDCQHDCIDTIGSYYCTCNDGYLLGLDGKKCYHLDEDRCLDGWETTDNGCYQFFHEKRLFNDAQNNVCAKFEGYISSIHTFREQYFLVKQAERRYNYTNLCDHWMIGIKSPLDYHWIDKTKMDFQVFGTGSDSSGKAVVMWKDMGWKWIFTNEQFPMCYICKQNNKICEESLSKRNFLKNVVTKDRVEGFSVTLPTTFSSKEIEFTVPVVIHAVKSLYMVPFHLSYIDYRNNTQHYIYVYNGESQDIKQIFLSTMSEASTITSLRTPIETEKLTLHFLSGEYKFHDDEDLSEALIDFLGCPFRNQSEKIGYELCSRVYGPHSVGYYDPLTQTYKCDQRNLCYYDRTACQWHLEHRWNNIGKCKNIVLEQTWMQCNQIKYCNHYPCLFGGTCIESPSTYRCECIDPFFGPKCEMVEMGFEMYEISARDNFFRDVIVVFRNQTELDLNVVKSSVHSEEYYFKNMDREINFEPSYVHQSIINLHVEEPETVIFACPFSGIYNTLKQVTLTSKLIIGALYQAKRLQFTGVDPNILCDYCFESVWITGTSPVSSSPYKITIPVYIYQYLTLELKMSMESLSHVTTNWTLYRSTRERDVSCLLDADYTLVYDEFLTGIDDSRFLKIPPSNVFPQNYRVCVDILRTYHGGEQDNFFYCGYFKTPYPDATKLFPLLVIGGVRIYSTSIYRWNAIDPVTVDGVYSIDPNVFSNTNITYQWSCRYDRGGPCQFTNLIYNEDKFNPVLSESKMVIPGGVLDQQDYFSIQLTISKPGSTLADNYIQTSIYPPSPSSVIFIRCTPECLGKKMNPIVNIKVEVINYKHSLQFEWKIESQTRGYLSQTDVESMVIDPVMLHTKTIIFKPDAFNYGEKYYVETTGSNGETIGPVGRLIELNIPPLNGTCFIEPKTGRLLFTEFTLTCQGYVDVDQPLKYVLSSPLGIIPGKESNSMEIHDGVNKEIFLPLGDADIDYNITMTVTITDTYNVPAYSYLQVQVYPFKEGTDFFGLLLEQVETLVENSTEDHHSSQPVKKNLVIFLNIDNHTNQNATEDKTKIRTVLIEDINHEHEDMSDDLESIDKDAELLSLLVDNAAEITEEAEEIARESFQHMSSNFVDLKPSDKNQTEEIAWKLLDGTSKLMTVNMERGKEYLASVNQTHGHVNNTNVTMLDHDAHNTEHILKERNATKKFIKIFDTISSALFDIVVPDQPPVVINTSKLSLIVGRFSTALNGFTQEVGSSGVFVIPEIENGTDPNKIPVGYQIGEYKENPYLWSPSAKDIDIPVVSMVLKNADGDELVFKNVSTPFDIEVYTKRTPQYGNKNFEIELTAAYNFHTLEIGNSDSSLLILPTVPNKVPILFIKPLNTELTVQVLPLLQPRNLTLQDIEDKGYKIPIPKSELKVFKHFTQDPHVIFFPEVTEDSNTTEFYVGISITQGQILSRSLVDATGFDGDIAVKVHVELFLSQCAFWDVENETWSQDGCVLTNFSNVERLHCQCNHLTAFSGGVLIKPNLLDPISDAKLFLKFFDNPVVVVTIMVIWVLYIFLMCWARKEDEKDLRQRGVTVLEDNDKEDNYMYLVGVLTGWWKGAGTTSDVFIYLRSRHNQSSRHALIDEERPQFMSGSEDWFLLTTPDCIGPLKSVVIWHDNAGKSPSWFLKEVIVRDVQTGESWHCIYDNWLSVDRGPKEIRAEISSIVEGEIVNQSMYQFYLKSSQDFRDGHLWASIFSKPITSNFTRCQRLTCALSLLIFYMLANLMFLGIPDTISPRDQVMFDDFTFDLNDIIIGVETALVTFPINLLILQLFIRLSPKKQVSDIKKSKEYYTQQAMDESEEKKKKEFKLPWWFLYVAWSVALFSALLCSYFVMLYGLKFGYAKSSSWLITFFTSFSQSALITQPCKVVLIAVIVTLVLKRPASYTPSVTDDDLEENEEYLHKRIIEKQTMWEETKHEPQHYYIPPMSNNIIHKIQHRLRIENIMREAWREIFMYVVFVVIVFLTVHGHRDQHTSFMFSQTNVNMFIDAKYTDSMKFNEISSRSKFWKYTQETLLSNIKGEKLIQTIDGTSYILGKIRLRQVRADKDVCDLPYYNLYGLNNNNCTASYWIGYDDTGFYNQSWNNEVPEPDSPVNFTEWSYQGSWQLSLAPFMGDQATYPGSGFVLEIPLNKTEANMKLLELEEQNWIDDRTRAVFIELTLYNPNENLFSVVILLVEFTNFAAILPMYQIYTSTLYYYSNDFEMFVAVCEVLFIMFVIAYTYFEIKKLSVDVKTYFKDVWCFIEIGILMLSYAAIGIYIQRILAVNSVLEQYKSSDGQSFLSFYPALSWDYSLQHVLAALVTIVVVKFFKLLKFNKNMAFLSKTLHESRSMLSGFTSIVTIATAGFGMFAFLVFGTHMRGYSSPWKTITTLFSFLLGVSDYYGLLAANTTLGPLFFFFFSLFFQYILMTMLLAIIITSFHYVRNRERGRINELQMINYLFDKWILLVDG